MNHRLDRLFDEGFLIPGRRNQHIWRKRATLIRIILSYFCRDHAGVAAKHLTQRIVVPTHSHSLSWSVSCFGYHSLAQSSFCWKTGSPGEFPKVPTGARVTPSQRSSATSPVSRGLSTRQLCS